MLNPWNLFPAARLRELADSWDHLNEACHGPPVLQTKFLCRALESFGTGKEVLAVCGVAGKAQAMALLVHVAPGRWQTFQPSQLPLGPWLMRPEFDYRSMTTELFKCLPGMPLMLGITQQDPAMFQRPASSTVFQTLDYVDTGWVEFRGDYEAYWSDRRPSLRQNVRTQLSRLRREGITPVLDELTHASGVAAAIEDYARLESSGWKAVQGTALAAGSIQSQFYRAAMEDFCANGQGKIYRLYFGNRVVAVDLCIVASGVEVLLKTTYDEGVRGISPSTLLKHLAWRRRFESGDVSRCEFFGPFMPWSSLWTENRRTLFHLNCFRWAAATVLRDLLRTSLVPPIPATQALLPKR